MSAIAPAGKVNNVEGSAETVAIREIITVEAPSECSAQKTAMLWAPMQLPEITIANQSFRKARFLNASQVEVFLEVSSMGGVIELECSGSSSPQARCGSPHPETRIAQSLACGLTGATVSRFGREDDDMHQNER